MPKIITANKFLIKIPNKNVNIPATRNKLSKEINNFLLSPSIKSAGIRSAASTAIGT